MSGYNIESILSSKLMTLKYFFSDDFFLISVLVKILLVDVHSKQIF